MARVGVAINFSAESINLGPAETDAEQDRAVVARLRAVQAAICRGERYPPGYHALRRAAEAAEHRLALLGRPQNRP